MERQFPAWMTRLAESKLGQKLIRAITTEVQEEVSDDQLEARVKLRDAVQRIIPNPDFDLVFKDCRRRITEKKDLLVQMNPVEFRGAKGIELKGAIRGAENVFASWFRDMTARGDAAEITLSQRRQEANKRQ